jgi:hypothetical protein
VSREADIHIARATRMLDSNCWAAKAYLRHLALSSLRHARALSHGPYGSNVSNQQHAERVREDGIAYARACRVIFGGPIKPADVDFPWWKEVPNPHWPELSSHGVYVQIHEYRGSKADKWLVEVQVLPPDAERSQCCANVLFADRDEAERYARRWVTIGDAVIAAQIAMNCSMDRKTA